MAASLTDTAPAHSLLYRPLLSFHYCLEEHTSL